MLHKVQVDKHASKVSSPNGNAWASSAWRSTRIVVSDSRRVANCQATSEGSTAVTCRTEAG